MNPFVNHNGATVLFIMNDNPITLEALIYGIFAIYRIGYGLGTQEPLTQHEVADLIGISRSYVSRIEKKALKKLRNRYESEY